MKTTILEIDGFPMITIRLDRKLAGSMTRAARSARELLDQGQVRRDIASNGLDMLDLYERGAERLAILGKTRESRLLVDPTFLVDAHTMTCLLASRQNLQPRDKMDLLTILDLLAAIFPVLVKSGSLPHWEEIQIDGKGQGGVRKIYEELCERPLNDEGCRIIKMGDALVLREGLRLKSHPAILRLWKDLSLITATHRHAVDHVTEKRA